MSNIKHIDKDIIVRNLFSFPSDPMTVAQGVGYPIEQSVIDSIINNGVNGNSFSELSNAFRIILQSVEGEPCNIYKDLSSETIDKLTLLIREWSNGGAGIGSTVYLAVDCIEYIFSFYRSDLPDSRFTLPAGANAFDLWDINKDENTATISDGNGGTFLIEFHRDELDHSLKYEEDFSDHTMGLVDHEETWGYFYSEGEIQYIIDDLKSFIMKINDFVRKYNEKYVLKIN